MYKRLFPIVLVLLAFSLETQSTKCVSFNNISLNVKDSYGEEFNITSFSGVVERISFGNRTLRELYVRQQDVQQIGAECVRHMVGLKTLSFWSCPIKTISPGAIRNLPRLRKFELFYGNLTRIPAGLFNATPTLRLIRLDTNKITSIEVGAFANLPDLRILFMDNNELSVWENSWFVNTTNIEVLDFRRNKLEVIPSRAFFGMSKLKVVYFDNNEIRTIEPDSFLTVHDLDHLGLRYNRLKVLNEDIFPDKLSVKSLQIDVNYLNYLSNELLKKLSVKAITLDGNPWKCPCLDRIHYWIYTKNVTWRSMSNYCNDPNIPLCFYPESYSSTCLENTDEKMSKLFAERMRKLKPKVNRFCAHLD